MAIFIYFEESDKRKCAIRFVSNYRTAKWYRREKIGYSLLATSGMPVTEATELQKIYLRIEKDYPDARIYCTEWEVFRDLHKKRQFWVICKFNENSEIDGYYSCTKRGNVEWTNDIDDADIYLDNQTADESGRTIGQLCQPDTKIGIAQIYLNLVNELLTPIFMITCTSKTGKQSTQYFAKLDGNRLRLVRTSDAAKKFTYSDVLAMFEHLKSHNKNFLYAVLPAFKDNVHCNDIERYIGDMRVSRLVQMDIKLKSLNKA